MPYQLGKAGRDGGRKTDRQGSSGNLRFLRQLLYGMPRYAYSRPVNRRRFYMGWRKSLQRKNKTDVFKIGHSVYSQRTAQMD